MPIHFSDFHVAFECGGVISLLENIRPNFRNFYFISSNETKFKAFKLPSYEKALEYSANKFIWIDESKFFDKTWHFHYWRVNQQMFKMHVRPFSSEDITGENHPH